MKWDLIQFIGLCSWYFPRYEYSSLKNWIPNFFSCILSFYSVDRSFSHVSIQISLISLAYECIKVKTFDFNNLEI